MKILIKKILITLSVFAVPFFSMAQQLVSIEDFVSRTYFQGIPYEQAIQYDENHVPQLKTILNDNSQSQLWSNAIVMLEIIGGEQELDYITRFILNEPEGKYSLAHERAKNAAIYGLGYVINHTGSKRALRYLVESLEEETWTKRDVRGLGKLHKNETARNTDFSKYAMLGLALSGESEAILEIKKFKSKRALKLKRAGRAQTEQDKFNRTAKMALEEGGKVRTKGLLEYYRAQHQHNEKTAH